MLCQVVDQQIPVDDGHRIAATLFVPDVPSGESAQPVLFLFAGGGYNRRYFDIQSPDGQDYSQGRWHADRGLTVVALDHLGTGDSTVPANGVLLGGQPMAGKEDALSRERIEAANDAAVRHVLARLRDGTLVDGLGPITDPIPIGFGHSAGGHIVVGSQADLGTFAAVALAGASFTGTRLASKPGRRFPFRAYPEEHLHWAAGLDTDWAANNYWDDVPSWARGKSDAGPHPWLSPTTPQSIAGFLGPYASAQQAANVRVPALLLYGQQDVTVEPLADVAVFRSAPEVGVMMVPRMAHLHNFASTRKVMWARLHAFATDVAMLHELDYPGAAPALGSGQTAQA